MTAERLTPPNLRDRAEQLAQGLPPLLVDAERLAASLSIGVHGRRKAGMGESFWQFRRYRPEDAASAIDWRQSAKSQHLFVREREWEAAEAVWFWRDGGAGMRYASAAASITKIDCASVLLLALAALLVRGGEKIALLGDRQGPGLGRAALNRMAHRLEQDTPALPLEVPQTRHGQCVWFSDFLQPVETLAQSLTRLAQNGLSGHLVHIVDPAEADFPFSGRTRFQAPGSDASQVLGRAENVRAAYQQRFIAHSQAVHDLARRQGWRYLIHRTDRPAQTALIALYAAVAGDVATTQGA